MWRKPSNARRSRTRRTWPMLEVLEDRRLPSLGTFGHAAAAADGVLSQKGQVFSYITPSGGHAQIKIIGIGSLAGTTVNSSGALNLVFGGTNAYSKIVSTVTGGDGRAPLASILNSQLIAAGVPDSLSGIGGNVVQSVYLTQFDLVAGGVINLTAGVNALTLDSVGPGTQVNLRAIPSSLLPPYRLPSPLGPSSSTTSSSVSTVVGVTNPNSSLGSGVGTARVVTPTPTPTSTTNQYILQPGKSTTLTTSQGVSLTYSMSGSRAISLTSISGSFTAGTNIVQSLATNQPPSLPPAPPGVILKINHVSGNAGGPIDPLTDSKIFGYDPTKGQLVRFDLNLTNDTGSVDPTFTPISVPGHPAVAGVNLGRDGSQLVVLVSSGPTVYAYNATTGAPVGSFTTSLPINSIASTDNVTVLGSYQTNRLYMINLSASLQQGAAVPAKGNPPPFTPAAGFTLLGGLASVPGSPAVYATIAATFNSFQPTKTQLGVEQILTSATSSQGTVLSNRFSSVTQTAITQSGQYTNVEPNPPNTTQPGSALGSVDQSLALVRSAANGVDVVNVLTGNLIFSYPDLLVGLSDSFRADLTDSALIDIQGDVQSFRGRTAAGLLLNDTGNLNLVKFNSLANSTIIGQPVGHIEVTSRSNTSILSTRRDVGTRNGVQVVSNLQPIGPLSQTGD